MVKIVEERLKVRDIINEMMPVRTFKLDGTEILTERQVKSREYFNNLVGKDSVVRSMAFTSLLLVDTATEAPTIQRLIIGAFDPIVDLMAGLSYPVCYIMLATGLLLIMSGNKSKGIEVLKWACIGFLGMQFLPILMKMLVGVGEAMSKSAKV